VRTASSARALATMGKVVQGLAGLLLTLGITACSDVPEGPPAISDLAGTYVLTDQSVEFLVSAMGDKSAPKSTLRLDADGRVSVQGMPAVYTRGDVEGRWAAESGSGTWKIDKTERGYGIELHIDAGGTMRPAYYSATSILLKGRRAPYTIEFNIGDPDMNYSVEYGLHGS
jgi:hypothetical protein